MIKTRLFSDLPASLQEVILGEDNIGLYHTYVDLWSDAADATEERRVADDFLKELTSSTNMPSDKASKPTMVQGIIVVVKGSL